MKPEDYYDTAAYSVLMRCLPLPLQRLHRRAETSFPLVVARLGNDRSNQTQTNDGANSSWKEKGLKGLKRMEVGAPDSSIDWYILRDPGS